MVQKVKFIIICMFLVIIQSRLFATTDYFDLDLKDLMNLSVTTASKYPENINEVPSSVVIMTREEIQNLGYRNLNEIIQNLPGFYMIDDYYWLGNVNFGVRGFFSTGPFNNVIILVNGVNQISDKYSDYPDTKINVPVESIEKIEVIRGPNGVIYGTGAFFGVINIITQKEYKSEEEHLAKFGYGSFQTYEAGFKFNKNIGDLSLNVNASFINSNGMDIKYNQLTSDTNTLKYVGVDGNTSTDGLFLNKRKYVDVSFEYQGLIGNLNYAETSKGIFDGLPNKVRSEFLLHAMNVTLTYNTSLLSNLSSKFKFGYYTNDHFLDYGTFGPDYYEFDGQNTKSIEYEVITLWDPHDNIEFTSGIYRRTVLGILQISDFSYYGLNYGAGEIGLPKDDVYSTSAIYSQMKFKILKNFFLTGGLRVEHLDDYNIHYTRGIVSEDPNDQRPKDSLNMRKIINTTYYPENNGYSFIYKTALVYDLNENNTFKLLVSIGKKQPSFSENYRQLLDSRPFLNAAQISTYELNYLSMLNDNVYLNLSLYKNELNNLISTKNEFDNETHEWLIYSSNSGKMETYGGELNLKMNFNKVFIFNLNLCYQKSKDLRAGYENIKPGYSPEWLFYSNIIYAPDNKRSISLIGKFIDKMESDWVTETSPENGRRIGTSSPAQFILDLNFRHNYTFNGLFNFNFRISNLLNTEVRYPTTKSNSWIDKGYLGEGRTYYFTIEYNFH